MSDESNLQAAQVPAPLAIDNNRVETLRAGLYAFRQALGQIPDYTDQSEEQWAQLRDTHWLPRLRELDRFCRLTAELYPAINLTTNQGYHHLTNLMNADYGGRRFQVEMGLVAAKFQSYRISLGPIPDDIIRVHFTMSVRALVAASDQLTEDIRNGHYNRAKF